MHETKMTKSNGKIGIVLIIIRDFNAPLLITNRIKQFPQGNRRPEKLSVN